MSSPAEVPLRWRPSPMALSFATCALTALIAALLSGQWKLLVFAAPLLGVLGARRWLPTPAAGIAVRGTLAADRCFEGEEVTCQVTIQAVGGQASLSLRPMPTPALQLVDEAPAASRGATYQMMAVRWGSYPVRVAVTATATGGLLTAQTTAHVADLRVYPFAPAEPIDLAHRQLANRLGTHLSRSHGPGVEYADIRAYVPGDQLRSVNWPASARRGQLQVTERFTDRAADVVSIIDTYPQEPGPATQALELSVRGATQVVQSTLQHGDRAGLVALGARVRWLGPDGGRRQFYRVLDAVLDVDQASRVSTGTLAPPQALRPRSTVVAFSTLLRTDFTLAMLDLRKRGHTVLVIDVLRGAPFEPALDPIAARLWRLERRNVHRDLGLSGIEVVGWPADSALGTVLGALDRRPVRR